MLIQHNRQTMIQKSDNPLYWRFKKGPLAGRPMIQVNGETGCWIWQGSKFEGYGKIRIPHRMFPGLRLGSLAKDGFKSIKVHQLTYFMRFGNPPRGKELGHTCSRRSCCNPEHVRPIDPRGNKAEMFYMPELSHDEVDAITERLLADYPMGQIANEFGISIWSIRKLVRNIGNQLDLLEEVPF